MKKVLIIWIILLGFTVKAQWVQMNSPTTLNLKSVFFLDDKTGWVCGEIGTVLKTSDGGETWTFSGNINRAFNLLSIRFYDSLKGIVVGSKASIYTTEDGGVNWSLKNLNPDGNLNQVKYVDSAKVVVVGDSGTILYSSDWGNSWQTIANSTGKNNLYSVVFSNKKAGWIGGDGVILNTANGGTYWKFKAYSLNETKLFALNDTLLWKTCWEHVTGNFDPPHHYIELSTNGGASWTKQYNGIGTRLPAIYLDKQKRGFVLDCCDWLKITTDGGLNWQHGERWPGEFNDFYFIDIARGWMVGEAGVIFRTTNGGGVFTHVEEKGDNFPTTMLLQNYPNPFNPVTKITYSMPQTGFVKLKVFDLLGNEIATLVNEEKQKGNYEIEFDGTRLSSGIYFYQAIVGKNVVTKKMVLIK